MGAWVDYNARESPIHPVDAVWKRTLFFMLTIAEWLCIEFDQTLCRRVRRAVSVNRTSTSAQRL